jgi:hypothetical protein
MERALRDELRLSDEQALQARPILLETARVHSSCEEVKTPSLSNRVSLMKSRRSEVLRGGQEVDVLCI